MHTILIVDDDVYIGDMLEEILEKEGYRTARAYSGTETLMFLSSARPDLILLDLRESRSLGQGGSSSQWSMRLYHKAL